MCIMYFVYLPILSANNEMFKKQQEKRVFSFQFKSYLSGEKYSNEYLKYNEYYE